jgi:hypothetical protein
MSRGLVSPRTLEDRAHVGVDLAPAAVHNNSSPMMGMGHLRRLARGRQAVKVFSRRFRILAARPRRRRKSLPRGHFRQRREGRPLFQRLRLGRDDRVGGAARQELALKRYIGGAGKGLTTADLFAAVREEFKENENLPNTTNPDDWAKIAGKKGDRIVYVKSLVGQSSQSQRSVEKVVNTGQHL